MLDDQGMVTLLRVQMVQGLVLLALDQERVHIKWFCHDQIYVRSLDTTDKAYQAGPGL